MLTYMKPKELKYTDLAIWIDNNVYSGTFDVETCYKYLYLLCAMLTAHLGFFRCEKDLDEFSLFVASGLYNRLTNKKQFETKPDGTPKMEKITSILNYMKNVLPRYKYDFDIVINGMPTDKNVEVITTPTFAFDAYVGENTYIYETLDPSFSFQGLSGIVKRHLKKIPYKKHSAEWENIYISCLLTLLNTVTLDQQQQQKLKTTVRNRRFLLDNLYKDLRHQDPILYHLPDSYKNYILTLVNELRDVIAAEVSWSGDTHINCESSVENLLLYSYGKEENNEYTD